MKTNLNGKPNPTDLHPHVSFKEWSLKIFSFWIENNCKFLLTKVIKAILRNPV